MGKKPQLAAVVVDFRAVHVVRENQAAFGVWRL
jgi:hypothetical protein